MYGVVKKKNTFYVINALTDSPEPRKYGSVLKGRLKKEGEKDE